MRKLTASILLAFGLMGTAVAETTPATTPAASQNTPSTQPAVNSAEPTTTTPSAEVASVPAEPAQGEAVNTTVVNENIEIATEAPTGVLIKTYLFGECTKMQITWLKPL